MAIALSRHHAQYKRAKLEDKDKYLASENVFQMAKDMG
jgi:hypothetical protein